jgi:hypothetical protein
VLIVQPWVEALPGARGWDCSGLTDDAAAEGRDERVTLRRCDWTGSGFDLDPTTPRQVLPHPTGEGVLVAVSEPGAAAVPLDVAKRQSGASPCQSIRAGDKIPGHQEFILTYKAFEPYGCADAFFLRR